MTTNIKIREAAPDDALGIATVHVETWRRAYAGIAPDDVIANLSLRKREQMWAGHFANRDLRKCIKVADVDGEVIGFVTAGPNRGDEDDISGEVYAISVLPDYQGRGVGRDLISPARIQLSALSRNLDTHTGPTRSTRCTGSANRASSNARITST